MNEYITNKLFQDSFQDWWFGGEEISDFEALSMCHSNISTKASKGRIDPVIGRDVEVQRVVQTLGRRRKNNPALLGEPGVGKTAIAEGLALRILNKKVPEVLYDRKVLALDVGLLLAGTRYRGEFELRFYGRKNLRNTRHVQKRYGQMRLTVVSGSKKQSHFTR